MMETAFWTARSQGPRACQPERCLSHAKAMSSCLGVLATKRGNHREKMRCKEQLETKPRSKDLPSHLV